MTVIGTGVLANPDAVLSPEERHRLEQARDSDATVLIRTPAEVGAVAALPAPSGEKTWRYHMASTRDVAFTASRAFVWDAARIDLPGGENGAGRERLPGRERGPGRLEPLDRIHEGRCRAFLPALVRLPLSGRDSAWPAAHREWNIQAWPSTGSRTRARPCSGSPRTRSATPGFP